MATREDKVAFLKLWNSPEVKNIEDFRARDKGFSGDGVIGKEGTKPIEGKPDTYPSGYTNQSLNQKAQRYLNATDAQGNSYKHKDWTEPFEGAVKRDAKGNMMKDAKGLYIGRTLRSGKSRGGAATQWQVDDFSGFKAADWQ